jgi:hypothetical protein
MEGVGPAVMSRMVASTIALRVRFRWRRALSRLRGPGSVPPGSISASAAGASGSGDAVTRVEQLSRAVNSLSGSTMHLGRALIRLTVEAEQPRNGAARRGYRRIEWIERALESVRSNLTRKEFERLVSALSIQMGWEALIVLKDVRGLEQKEAEDVLAFAARAIVDASLHAPRQSTDSQRCSGG